MSGGVANRVHHDLVALAHQRKADPNRVIQEFGRERFLYRLGEDQQAASAFILKGATLFAVWPVAVRRPTRDLDFLMFEAPSADEARTHLVRIAGAPTIPDDGVVFDPASLTLGRLRMATRYPGFQARLEGTLAGTRLVVELDIGVGDAVTPPVKAPSAFPQLLARLPAPQILLYPKETVIAEKLEIIAHLGLENSRLKDYFDLELLASTLELDGSRLLEAVSRTFTRRGTPVPEGTLDGLTPDYAMKWAAGWKSFVRKYGLEPRPSLEIVVERVRSFVTPVLDAIASAQTLTGVWRPGLGWVRS